MFKKIMLLAMAAAALAAFAFPPTASAKTYKKWTANREAIGERRNIYSDI